MNALLGTLVLTLWVVGHASAASSTLDVIELPVGFNPEGITLGEGWTAYVGSLNDGSIWKGDLSSGKGEEVLSDVGGAAMGLEYDRRSGYLFVAGGYNGTARVYDTKDFRLVADIQLAGDDLPLDFDPPTFANDIVLTKAAAYVSDSVQPQLYKIPLDEDSGKLASGKDTTAISIPYSSAYNIVFTGPNGNGIEATEDGKTIIVMNMAAGELYTVDPDTGEVALINLDDTNIYGDGLVLRENTLWVVENGYMPGGRSRIVEVALSSDLSCGSVVRNLTSEYFDDPSTAVRKGESLYAVNAKFETTSVNGVETTPFEIIRVDRDAGDGACLAG